MKQRGAFRNSHLSVCGGGGSGGCGGGFLLLVEVFDYFMTMCLKKCQNLQRNCEANVKLGCSV